MSSPHWSRQRLWLLAAVALLAALAPPAQAQRANATAAAATNATQQEPLTLEEAAWGAESVLGNLAPGLYANESSSPRSQPSSAGRRLLQSSCSSTDSSASAVLACINAVRVNPSILSDAPCYSSISSWLSSPPRQALNSNSALAAAAKAHNDRMIAARSLSHQLPGEPGLRERMSAAGYLSSYASENVAAGQGSARAVVTSWLCSPGHRENMFACNVRDMGVASGGSYLYYTQKLACPMGQTCNSCSGTNPNLRWFQLQPSHSVSRNMCWDIKFGQQGNGALLQQYDCNKSNAQKFRLVDVGGGYYNIVDVSGRCVDLPSNAVLTQLTMWSCHGGDNQKFYFEGAGAGGGYRLRPRSSNKCVGVSWASTAAWAPILHGECNGNPDQTIRLYNF